MIRNGFIKKSIGTLTLGEKLKKIRGDRRLSLNEISRNTKIQVKYLEYLENGEYNKLPAQVYVKGFLRSYAEFLGADEQLLARLYDKELDIQKNLETRRCNSFQTPLSSLASRVLPASMSGGIKKISPIRISSFVITPRLAVIAGVIVLVMAGAVYLYKEIGSFASTPRLVIVSPSANHPVVGNSISVEGYTDRDSRIFINDQPILVNDEGKFREDLTLQSGTNMLQVKAINRFEKETAQLFTLESTYQDPETEEVPREEGEKKKENESNLEAEIRVDPGPVWLSVESDGNLVFSGTMLTGAVQSFRAEDKILINSGKGSATFVKLNGQDFGALSNNPGAVRGVTFTKETKHE